MSLVSALICVASWIERAECRVVGVPRAEFKRVVSAILHGDATNGVDSERPPGVPVRPRKPIDARKRDSFYFLMKSMQARRRQSQRYTLLDHDQDNGSDDSDE